MRDSLHVEHLLPVMTLARFQRFGHRDITIAGGAMAVVGVPSERSEERNLLSPEEIEHNLAAIQQQLAGFLNYGRGSNAALLLNNADWLAQLRYEWL